MKQSYKTSNLDVPDAIFIQALQKPEFFSSLEQVWNHPKADFSWLELFTNFYEPGAM